MARRRDDILTATRAALRNWAAANWFDLPHLSKPSTEPLSGKGTRFDGEPSKEIQEVERVVNELYRTEPQSRMMIVIHYLHAGSCWKKIKQAGVSSRTYYSRLEHAEYAVKVGLGY